jgi:hypothetical protein
MANSKKEPREQPMSPSDVARQDCAVMAPVAGLGSIRSDWTSEEVRLLWSLPFGDLL